MMTKLKVAIIGAGTSGLAAIKCCLEEGLEPVCFEKTRDIGGLWCFRERKDKYHTTTVYKSTVTNTSKEMMTFSDFPIPDELPNFLHNADLNRYLNLYADKFGLRKHIVFGTNVKLVRPAPNFASTGRWILELENAEGGQRLESYDAVIVANGHHGIPHRPDFPGLEGFQGDVIHTKDYKKPDGYEDKRVLVIGIGNSGCDAADEVSRVASKVFQSSRSGAWVIPRWHTGEQPIDTFRLRRASLLLPVRFYAWKIKRLMNTTFNQIYRHLNPKHDVFAKGITINDQWPWQVVNGHILTKPGISQFHETGVEFEDGTFEEIDSVIMATGYDIDLPIDTSVIPLEHNNFRLYRNVFSPNLEHPTLAVIGLVAQGQNGSVNPISEMQSRWATRVLTGSCKLPSRQDMEYHIRKRIELRRKSGAIKACLMVDFIPYMDEIAGAIGVKPRIWMLLLQNPVLALRCFFGPCFPYQYRLMGPGKWEGVKEAIETAWARVEKGGSRKQNDSNGSTMFQYAMVVLLLGVSLYVIRLLFLLKSL